LFLLTDLNVCTEITNSVLSFSNIIKLDPYRIDNYDLLSNLMYVSESREEMVILSKYVESIDRYRQETLCVIGMILINRVQNLKQIVFYFVQIIYSSYF